MAVDDRGDRLLKIAADLEGIPDEDRAEMLVRLGQGEPLEDVEASIADRCQRVRKKNERGGDD
jgi:hypothetical protein